MAGVQGQSLVLPLNHVTDDQTAGYIVFGTQGCVVTTDQIKYHSYVLH